MLVRILLAGEHRKSRNRLRALLDQSDLVVEVASSADEVWRRFARENFDLLLIDRSFLGDSPDTSVESIRALPGTPELIVVQEGENPETRAELLAAGCLGIVDVGVPDAVLASAIEALVARRRDMMLDHLRAEEVETSALGDFSSRSLAMQELLALAERVSQADTSLLILGETGVGKEWLARAIHADSARRAFPFLALNCGAVPDTLIESELFGHEKGAFTGADRSRRGQFEMAHGGTLFLDEIADMPPHLQGKLLRVLQDKSVYRLGSEKALQVDVRIMAATNRDLDRALEDGSFRADLYYRLSVVTLTVPPLRERKQDIQPLIETYLEEFSNQLQRDVRRVRPEVMEALNDYRWPGNVRELINVMERAVLLSTRSEIGLDDLPPSISGAGRASLKDAARNEADYLLLPTGGWTDRTVAEVRDEAVDAVERAYLSRQLSLTGGRIGETAQRAGITPRSLYDKMKKLGLQKEDFKPRTTRDSSTK